MGKALIVTQHYLKGNGGGIFASRAYINAFAEIYDKVTLLYPFKPGMEIGGINEMVKAIPVENDKNKFLKLIDIFLGRVHRYSKIFEQTLIQERPDLVVFDNSRVSYKLIDIAHKHGCKVVTIHHNYEYEYIRDNSKSWLKPLGLFWVKRYEKEAVIQSDLSLALTEQDIDLLVKNYHVDKNKLRLIGCFESERKESIHNVTAYSKTVRFVITGGLADKQTERSLLPWIDVYYPILKQQFPDATLVIAGRAPSKRIKDACISKGINLIDSPKDMQQILQECDVYLSPIDLGGGLKLRIMDGLKNGVPVIAHEVSARGYDEFVRCGYLFTYRDKIGFVESLNKLKNMRPNAQEILDCYKRVFSFDEGVKRLKQILSESFLSLNEQK